MTPVRDHTDADLVAGLNRGDRKVFEAIYRKYAPDIYRYARKNIQAKEDCEEILQEVFESLWERHETIGIQKTIKSYLVGMVRYKIIHHFRKRTLNRRYTEHFLLFDAVYETAGEDPDGCDTIEVALEAVINELPARCQEAVRLRLSGELSNRDIAQAMNITIRTVERYMFLAYTHIRASYKLHLNE